MKIRNLLPLGLLTVLLVSCRHAGEHGMRLSPGQIADRTKPATVQVIAQFEASGTVAVLEPDEDRLREALERENLPEDTSRNDAYERLLDIFYSDPGSYLKEGNLQELDQKIYALGTGFIVTPDGYILTNTHVVEPDQDDLTAATVDSIQHLVDDEAAEMEKVVGELLPGRTPLPAASDRLKSVLSEQYAKHGKFHFDRVVHVVMPSSREETSDKVDERTCEIKKVGKANPGKDIAVLKIDGSDLPVAPLAASLEEGDIRTGATLYVLAYPGSLVLDPNFSDRNRIQPSMTGGLVSNVKEMSGGWQVIQTDATIIPGNSGGPTLNDRGEVVGLATFGLKDQKGVNFAESVDLAREFLRSLDVTPRDSRFTQQYDEALLEYERPGHGNALRMFRSLSASHPDLSGPRDFVEELSGAAPPRRELAPPPEDRRDPVNGDRISRAQASHHRWAPAVAVVGVVAVVLIVVVAVIVLVNRN